MSSTLAMNKVAILGAVTMGAGIAQVSALAGFSVCLFDIDASIALQGRDRIEQMLAKGVSKGKVSLEDKEATLARIRLSTELANAVDAADLVIEAVPERLLLKQEVFRDVEACVDPASLLASNTSSLSITEIARFLERPERFLGLHFFNPPAVMKLLEIVEGEKSSLQSLAHARDFALKIGKDPIVVKDSPGFASSRLGLVLGLEAMRMCEEGVASAQDIDKAMKLGYRHPMGPLELTDLVGLDVRLAIAQHLAAELDDRRFTPPKLLESLVAQGKLGKKSGEGFYRWVDGKPVPKS